MIVNNIPVPVDDLSCDELQNVESAPIGEPPPPFQPEGTQHFIKFTFVTKVL